MHSKPTIRGGGLVFIGLPLLALPILCYLNQSRMDELFIPLIAMVLLSTVSFLDDVYHLSAKPRFLVQLIAALLIVFTIGPNHLNFIVLTINHPFLVFVISVFAFLWGINHFNFMDGLDGFCASQALFLFTAYALLFHWSNALMYQDVCVLFVCSLCAFLLFNFPPAKLFMGDVGSATLGLIVFYIALVAEEKYNIPIVYWFMLNGLFLFDATITLIRRIIKKESFFSPHKLHAYQRLKQSGAKSTTILLGQLVMNSMFLNLVLLEYTHVLTIYFVVVIELLILGLVYFGIEKNYPMFLV